jgi:hypothetical protein
MSLARIVTVVVLSCAVLVLEVVTSGWLDAVVLLLFGGVGFRLGSALSKPTPPDEA